MVQNYKNEKELPVRLGIGNWEWVKVWGKTASFLAECVKLLLEVLKPFTRTDPRSVVLLLLSHA